MRVGIIGGGLMGREAASAFSRWFVLNAFPIKAELVAVCGHHMPFPVITGGIFEAGFPDCFLQMWAAYAAERAGQLAGRFGCVTPDEALLSHQLFAAALESHACKSVVPVCGPS